MQRLGVLNTEVNHRRFQRLVPQPVLDCAHRHAGVVPVGRASPAQAVEVVLLAHPTIVGAPHGLDALVLAVAVRLRDFRPALAADETGLLGDALELPDEPVVGLH